MTDIFALTESALATISPAVPYAMAPYKGALPDLYIVHQLLNDDANQHADNVETARSYLVQVTVWCVTGLSGLPDVDTAMKSVGFRKRNERQLPQDQQTGHYGLAMEFIYQSAP